jgi:hypothetical protein
MATKKTPAKKRATTHAKKAGAKSAPAKKAPAKAPVEHGHGLKPGQLVERTYKGKTLKMQVTATGFLFDGTEYRSLTAAAKAATKYPSISGVVFWIAPQQKKGGA